MIKNDNNNMSVTSALCFKRLKVVHLKAVIDSFHFLHGGCLDQLCVAVDHQWAGGGARGAFGLKTHPSILPSFLYTLSHTLSIYCHPASSTPPSLPPGSSSARSGSEVCCRCLLESVPPPPIYPAVRSMRVTERRCSRGVR